MKALTFCLFKLRFERIITCCIYGNYTWSTVLHFRHGILCLKLCFTSGKAGWNLVSKVMGGCAQDLANWWSQPLLHMLQSRVLCLALLTPQAGWKQAGACMLLRESRCWQQMEIFFKVWGLCAFLLFWVFFYTKSFSFTHHHKMLVRTTSYLVMSLILTRLTETSLKLKRRK